jgi:hypothetical protein
MSVLVRADGPASSGAVTGDVERAGASLTDEVFLYRVVRLDAARVGEMIELEDCYGLGVVRVPLRDVRERRLRAVTPTRVEG